MPHVALPEPLNLLCCQCPSTALSRLLVLLLLLLSQVVSGWDMAPKGLGSMETAQPPEHLLKGQSIAHALPPGPAAAGGAN